MADKIGFKDFVNWAGKFLGIAVFVVLLAYFGSWGQTILHEKQHYDALAERGINSSIEYNLKTWNIDASGFTRFSNESIEQVDNLSTSDMRDVVFRSTYVDLNLVNFFSLMSALGAMFALAILLLPRELQDKEVIRVFLLVALFIAAVSGSIAFVISHSIELNLFHPSGDMSRFIHWLTN